MLTAILALSACIGAMDDGGKTLATYDLTYTLKLDRNDPAALRRIWDETHFVTSVQGIVNRKAPRLYLFEVGDENAKIDHFWLERMRQPGEWLETWRLESIPDLQAFTARFRSDIKGLVVYDENVPATSNLASTIAGIEDLACVRYDTAPASLYSRLTEDLGIEVKAWLVKKDGSPMFKGSGTIPGSATPSTGSAKCDAYIWAKEQYLDTGKCNAAKMGYYLDAHWLKKGNSYIPNHTLTNHDYFISQRGFFFDLAPYDNEPATDDLTQPVGADAKTLMAILRAAYDQLHGEKMIHVGGFVPWDTKYTSASGGKNEPVPTEWRYAEILSSFNAFMDADAIGLCAMANASVFQHFPLRDTYPQKQPTVDDLKAKGLILPDGKVAPKHYVTIYVGDYDSAAWLYQRLPELYADSARGSVPIGWAINPNLADRFAPGVHYARVEATPQDVFVAGDSGAGYVNPGHLQEPRQFSGLPSGLDTWRKHCLVYYKKWDINITGFAIDGYAPAMNNEALDAYAAFSHGGLVAQKLPAQRGIHADMPFVTMNYDLVGSPEESAKVVLQRLGKDTPDFQIFRTILWRPTAHKRLYEAIKANAGQTEVEIVDPLTFFLLLKTQEQK